MPVSFDLCLENVFEYLYHDVPTMSLAMSCDALYLCSFEIGWCENVRKNIVFVFHDNMENHRNTVHGNLFNLGITAKSFYGRRAVKRATLSL